MAFLLLCGQTEGNILPPSLSQLNRSFFCVCVHSLKMILGVAGTVCLFFILLSGETWQKISECWGRVANESNPCSHFILLGCFKQEIKKPR